MTLTDHDHRLIAELINRYALHVDAREFDQVTRLFIADGVLKTPAPPKHLGPTRELVGPDAIGEELRQLEHFTMTFHGLAGHLIEADGPDQARGRVNCVAHHVVADGREAVDLVWHLRYADRYVRVDDAWAFARREITVELIDSRPAKRVNDRLTASAAE